MTDLDYGPDQRAFAATLNAFCTARRASWPHPVAAAACVPQLWPQLAELGVLELTATDSGAGPLDVAAAHEALGAGGCPGPLWATALAARVLDADEVETVVSGSALVTVGSPQLLPWAREATVAFDLSALAGPDPHLRRITGTDIIRDTTLLGGEPAAEVSAGLGEPLPIDATALALGRLALAAYLVGAAGRVLADVVAYARTRTQFRRTLGSFQAVAHPLADRHAALAASSALVRRAAAHLNDDPAAGADLAVLALGSAARSARAVVAQAHQAYGGFGFTLEGPLAWLGSRIWQLATEAEMMWRGAARMPGRAG